MRYLTILAALAVAILANYALWCAPNRPVPLEPPPGGKLRSISFAPFRDGQSPLTRVYPTPEQIDADLAVIAPQVAGIRTYTSLEGMETVPELAQKHGLTVTMGAWLSPKASINDAEVESLIDLANRYPDTITRVIVGNEVLLRGDLKPGQLIAYIRKVKAAVKQPVSYADVWEWWLKFPEIADEVDYLTIHLLPYWEDIPASITASADHIAWTHTIITERFPGKPILVGEAGWPTSGRTRGAAVPGRVEMARFAGAFVRLAEEKGFDYNLIEAFDQSWKQKLEGTVGGHWGLYTAERKPKFLLAGPVVELPHWRDRWAIAAGAGLLLFAGALALAPAAVPAGSGAALAFLTQGAASALVHATVVAQEWNYYPQDVALQWGLLAVLAVLTLALTAGFVRAAVARTVTARVLGPGALHGLLKPGPMDALERVGSAATLILGVVAVAWSFLIVFDGRYRNFPGIYMYIPALGLLALGWLRMIRRPAGMSRGAAFAVGNLFGPVIPVPTGAEGRLTAERWIGRLLVIGAVLTVVAEGVLPVDAPLRGWIRGTSAAPLSAIEWTHPNCEALRWALLQLLLAVPFLASARLVRDLETVTGRR